MIENFTVGDTENPLREKKFYSCIRGETLSRVPRGHFFAVSVVKNFTNGEKK